MNSTFGSIDDVIRPLALPLFPVPCPFRVEFVIMSRRTLAAVVAVVAMLGATLPAQRLGGGPV
jgi:hypothetical protein